MRYFVLILLGALALQSADPSAEALARAANKARNSGQLVRAYLLYAEAAARDPKNESYRVNRDGLKPLANMLSKAGVEKEPAHDDLLASVSNENEEPLPQIGPEERSEIRNMQPPVKLAANPGLHSFNIRGDERTLFNEVARAYGLSAVLDPQFEPRGNVSFEIENVDLQGALRALADETNTFVFPLTPKTIFVARDTLQKRDQFEPQIAVTVPLPDLVDDKATTEVANAVRQAFDLRHIGMDSTARTIVIRDKVSRAAAARVLLDSLIRPKAQVAVDVQILTVNNQSTLHYGTSLPNTFPIVNFGGWGLNQAVLAIPQGFVNFLTFGGGSTLFGIGIQNAQIFAMSTKSSTRSIFDATVVVSAGETAQLHVGDKFPIATMLYTGASQLPNAFYGPLPQVQQVDLGLLIKVKPELHSDGDITMDIHAEYQALGTLTFNTVPEILNRQFEGTVRLHSDQLAILAGLDTQTSSVSRTGIIGLSQIPAIGDLFSDVNRSHADSRTLLVVKPHPTRDLPYVDVPSYYVGGQTGRKVLL